MQKHFKPTISNCLKLSFLFVLISCLSSCSGKQDKILVFSKTVEFRHESIEDGVLAIQKLGADNNFEVDTTENAEFFTEDVLKQYAAVIFLNTTGDVLNHEQQADFERYIQAGGGFVGIHSATDTEYDWAWYNKLAGAYFENHPDIQTAQLKVTDKTHPSTEMLPDPWEKNDEWYNFKDINPDINVLIEIDETSYNGGTNGDHHPMAWYHEFDGGRVFYTGMGHRKETFREPLFLQHLLGGIQYAIGDNNLDYTKARTQRVPEETRFVKDVLDFNLDEPMEIDELPGKGILFIERRGALKLFDFSSASTKKVADIDVFYGNEDGLLGLAVDPNYKENNWIYLFYSAPGEISKQHISRFTLTDNTLDKSSEKILLTIPTIRACCHSGGGLEFDNNGNLIIGVGDNTDPFESEGFCPIDERPDRELWDAQRTAANTNDLRGKILRITPQPEGTYSIPEGNLFPEGTANARPEIYVMGVRNPFRFSIDSKTGFLYWGDVGPDAGEADPERGPEGMGEFNQARQAGFWGWPYTRGNNQVYRDYDFKTKQSGPAFDPENLINDSPNNTGLQKLPKAQPSMIWYSYDKIKDFPWLEDGGVNPMAGPIFHTSDFEGNEECLPDYFENKFFAYEWMRDRIYVISLDENQNYVKAEPFMPNTEFSHPMDMILGSDGFLYVLEYGQKWNMQNIDARLSKVRYLRGNRPPIAAIKADKEVGRAPLHVQFSAGDSKDYDRDDITYEWFFDSEATAQATSKKTSFTFSEAGIYDIKLRVTDSNGASSTVNKMIMVGNTPPELNIQLNTKDKIYRPGKEVVYNVKVMDYEDGSTTDQTINPEQVKVTISYLPEGEDLIMATVGHQQNATPEGQLLIDGSDCRACHGKTEKVNGPSYETIAKKYSKDDIDYLVTNIIKGSSGIWGESMMSAHPQLTVEEVQTIVKYILSLDPNNKGNQKSLPLSGTIEFKEHLGQKPGGKYILVASYLDEGNPDHEGFELSAQEQVIFSAPKIEAELADELAEELGIWEFDEATLVGSIVHNSYLKFAEVAFDNIESVTLAGSYVSGYEYKGMVELRKGSTTGEILGKAEVGYFDEEEAGRKTYTIPVIAAKGTGDLYLVFKNEENEEQFVMNANWILLNYKN